MLRIALFLIVAATMIGAMMPSHKADSSAVTVGEDGVTYTPQTSGSSYRVVDGSSGRSASTSSDGTLRLDREDDGHFYLDAQVNGRTVHFLVDTGASGVALSRDDAQAVGLALDRGTMKVGEGASGDVMGQWVELDSVEVGHRTVSDVPAVVMEGGLQSLLGQNVLREFDIEVHGDEMLLR
jgi:aspartyl protease family protein